MVTEPQAGPGPTVEELRACGYFLLPLPPKAKEPPPKGWKEHVEPYEIPAEGNVAVAVGERSGGLAVLITNDDASTTWATEKFGPPTVRSRRGGHWWFKAPFGTANEANAKTDVGQMELHAAHGKYVVVPPSIHPSGAPYTWSGGPTSNLPALPDLRDLWHPGGTHHTELLRQSAAKAHDGKDVEAIYRELVAWRGAHLSDPHAHPDKELRQLAESAFTKFHVEAQVKVSRETSVEEGIRAWEEMCEEMAGDFNLRDPLPVEFIFATLATLDMPGEPIWGFLVAPPSSLKTELLRWLTHIPCVYTLSSLTSASLITGLKGARSLLPELDGKCLVVKDFTTVLDMRREPRDEIIGQLRDAYDGYASKFFGSVGKVGFSAHFHFLAGVTSAIEDYWSIQATLGPRFLKVRMPEDGSGFSTALANSGEEGRLREKYEGLALTIYKSFPRSAWKEVGTKALAEIEPIVEMVARGRTHVPRANGFISRRPEVEHLPRLTKVLRKLAIGRAILYGRAEVDATDVDFLFRVAVDSMLEVRAHILRELGQPVTFVDMTERLHLPRTTLERYLDDMEALDMIRVGEEPDPRYMSEDRTRKVVCLGPKGRYIPPYRTLSGGTRKCPGGDSGAVSGNTLSDRAKANFTLAEPAEPSIEEEAVGVEPDPSLVYPGGVLAKRWAEPPDNVLYRPPGPSIRVVHESPWEVVGRGAVVIYSDGAVVRRQSGEVLGRFRVAGEGRS